ncbi:MAG: heme transporter CcmB [Lachnospiraceae bacterium]|nr:heme transporter CcmB [Lachnospiraceae bacterium]
MVPLTGLMVHKLVSVFFLILCAIHTIAYRKKMNWKRWGVLGIILVAFSSGIFGIVFEEIPVIIAMHKVISISSVFFLAIHIFVFHRKLTHQK